MRSRCNHAVANTRRAGGLTLIECIVAITIVALLFALLIPAVMTSREAARRAACCSNIRQICLGLNSYIMNYGCIPRGNAGHSLHYTILPFIDQRALYETIEHLGVNPARLMSVTVAQATPGIFLCPSDRPGSTDSGLGWTSYAGNRGSGYQTFGNNGLFIGPGKGTISPSDISDGTSKTAMISEWMLGVEDPAVTQGLRTVYHTPEALLAKEQLDEFAAACAGLDLRTAMGAPIPKGRNWLKGELGNTLYNHVLGPQSNSCLNGTGVQTGAFTASSLHPNGANVGFADGHIQFIKSSISRSVWRIGKSRGGELFSDDL